VLLEEGDMLTPEDFDLEPKRRRGTKRKIITAMPAAVPSHDEETLMMLVPLQSASASEVQRLLVRKVLERVGNNKMRASKILKISRPRLDRILRTEKPMKQ